MLEWASQAPSYDNNKKAFARLVGRDQGPRIRRASRLAASQHGPKKGVRTPSRAAPEAGDSRAGKTIGRNIRVNDIQIRGRSNRRRGQEEQREINEGRKERHWAGAAITYGLTKPWGGERVARKLK